MFLANSLVLVNFVDQARVVYFMFSNRVLYAVVIQADNPYNCRLVPSYLVRTAFFVEVVIVYLFSLFAVPFPASR